MLVKNIMIGGAILAFHLGCDGAVERSKSGAARVKACMKQRMHQPSEPRSETMFQLWLQYFSGELIRLPEHVERRPTARA